MHIKKVVLKNYRCFEDIEIAFHNDLTVIVGNNGSGKTSILEGMAVALGTLFTKMYVPSGKNIVRSDVRLKAYTIGKKDVQPQYPVKICAFGEIEGKDISWERSLNSAKGKTTSIDAKEMTDISMEYQKRLQEGDDTLVLPVVAYYGTGRIWDYHREKKSNIFNDNNRTNGYIDCLDGTANEKLMLNWFRKEAYEKYENQEMDRKSTPSLQIVYGAIQECYQKISGQTDVKVQYRISENEIYLHYRDSDGLLMDIPFSQLSDGYKNTMSMVADIAYRMYTLNPQLAEKALCMTPGVIMIDEVDLHLHPEWQHQILDNLRSIFPKIQFIVTTHAPAVISSARSDNLVKLSDYQVYTVYEEIHGNDINSLLKQVMDVSDRNPEVAGLFDRFHELLGAKNYEAAEDVLDDIAKKRNYHDQEVARCRVKLRLERLREGQK